MRKSMLSMAIWPMIAVMLAGASPASAASAPSKPNDSLNAPTFQEQTKNWTVTQFARYNAKMQAFRTLSSTSPTSHSSPAINTCCTIPNSFYASMDVVYEGSADCMCGPATATEMFSTFTYYYGAPSPKLTLSQVESQMNVSCSQGTYRTQLLNEMNNGSQNGNTYVWQAVNSATDVHNYTKTDLGGYDIPVGYDGETYSSRNGYPLDNYQNVDWQHYFPAYGYSLGYLNVADPHFNYDHQYTDQAIYLFIDNFPFTNQVLW